MRRLAVGLARLDSNETVLQINLAPVEPRNLSSAQTGKGADGQERDHFSRAYVRYCVDSHSLLTESDPLTYINRESFGQLQIDFSFLLPLAKKEIFDNVGSELGSFFLLCDFSDSGRNTGLTDDDRELGLRFHVSLLTQT